jgi:hypothetical protein
LCLREKTTTKNLKVGHKEFLQLRTNDPVKELAQDAWWLMPIILATQEAEIRRIEVRS